MAPLILVVGSGGQVGVELMRRCPAGLSAVGLTHAQLDVADANAVRSAIGRQAPAAVINASAYTAVDKAEGEADKAYAVNRDGPAALADACADAGIPLLHISTDYVFDGKGGQGGWREDDATGPLSVYGASKLAGELAIAERLDRHLILRTSWVFGAHGGNFVKTMLRLGGERPELRIVDDQQGGPTPAAAIADALYIMVGRAIDGTAPWGVYHFGGQPVTTWRRFAESVFAEGVARGMLSAAPTVHPIATADYPTPATRPLNSVFRCDKFISTFGMAAPDWRAGLAEVLDELKGITR